MKRTGPNPLNWDRVREMEKSDAALLDPKTKLMAVGLAHGPGTRRKKRKKKK